MQKMESIWTKLESGVGFSNGCDALAFMKPPPFVPSILIATCEAMGPCAIVWVVMRPLLHHRACRRRLDDVAFVVLFSTWIVKGSRSLALVVGLEILDHALRDQEHGEDEADGQQQVIGHPHEVHPEIANGLGRVPGDAAHQGGGDGDAHGGGSEVVERQPHHLREDRKRWIRRRSSASWCWS